MAKEFFLPVPLYLQVDCYKDTNEKCGAACTQMALHDIDPQRLFKKNEQNEIFDQIRQPPPGAVAWFNPPQGIKRVLNEQKPATRLPQRSVLKPDIQAIFASLPADPTTPYEFVIYGDSSPDTNPNPGIPRAVGVSEQIEQIELLSRQLIRTVALRGVAPVVAVREDNAHWIVVNGFLVEDDYRDADSNQRGRIKAIIIRNPLGRYTYSTVTCGDLSDQEMQVITGHKCELNPNVPDVAPYATWVREYMFSDWSETFVEVCDGVAQVADNFLARINSVASRTRGKSAMSAICNWLARLFRAFCGIFTNGPITANVAVDRAKRAIEEFNLSQLNRRVAPRNALPPYRVKRLDRIDGDYYLVPVGVENKISALINISVTGEFDGATVLPINTPRKGDGTPDRPKERYTAEIKQDRDTREFYKAIAEPNDHYIAPFDQHPQFRELTAGRDSSLRGRKIRLTDGGPLLTITSVIRDEKTPYVWRPGPNSFSASRPFHNLKITVQEREAPIPFYLPVDDYCLPVDGDGAITLPSANYLEIVTDCIKQKAGSMVDEVLVLISRSGTTAMVMYKSNQTLSIQDEKEEMRKIICKCLQDHRCPGLTSFRFKAFATNAFLTRLRGGGEEDPIIAAPQAGGGSNGFQIGTCFE
ncbi:MAG TPA: hypothetical protein VE715_14105 [Blastocatellia bacterium]|nr:hypothetical protein [Blastocatellia bacterium]